MRLTPCILLTFLLSCSIFTLSAQKRTSLDNDWKFHFGHAANPEKDFNYSLASIFAKSGGAAGTAIDPRFKDSAWRSLNVPHDWAVELPFVKHPDFGVESHGYKPVGGFFPETSIGWYRKKFRVAASDSGQRFQVQFDGVFRNASVWLNGFFVGQNQSGYIGVAYDITDVIRFDQENVLVVRVDATQYEGWFYEGAGIYRHVWLNQFNNVHIPTDDYFFHTKLVPGSAVVMLEATVHNLQNEFAGCLIQTRITTREGSLVAQTKPQALDLKPYAQQLLKQQLEIKNPRLWDIDDPYLYRITTEIRQAGKLVHTRTERLGVRTMRFDAEAGFFLNGRHVKILGTNNHQDHAGLGSALPDYMHYYRIRLLKNMGSNAYRTSHHAPTPELLDACDSLGMLVLDETRLLNSSAEYLDQFKRLVKRDRNHPSVFLWSIGNEEGWIQTTSTGKRIAQTMVDLLEQLDPSRTCTYAADLGNVFSGVNEIIPIRSFNYRHPAVSDYHRDHPTQPILGTEMGSTVTTRGEYKRDTIRNYLPDQDITAPWWASTAEAWWKPAAENSYWLGGFIWTGFDYRGEPTPFKWPNINSHFGVMDMCGFPKNLYYYYQSWWTNKDVLHISPHWNWHVKWGEAPPDIDVWVNSNADEVELFLNEKSLGKKTMPRNGHLKWNVTFAPGKLEAVAYKQGRTFRTHVETTGAPAEVVLTPYKTTMLADGKDVTVMNVSIIDREGREVPDASNMIRFRISGPGKIIGVGNGDPSSHEPDQCTDGAWQRSAFNGKCQVIVQSDTTAGMIRFEATSPGLWSGGTEIITVLPASVASIQIDPKYSLRGEAAKTRTTHAVLGADISFLPELEAEGRKFSDEGKDDDAIQILKAHGINYIRLRIFNDPAQPKGYSPEKGFCDLRYTKQMAKRVKDAGLKLLLDFHYSDYWADPGKQYKPNAWKNQSFEQLKQSLYDFTFQVMTELKAQGTLPDMVQVGNEVNHGIVWPEGSIAHPDSLAQLIQAGTAAVKAVHPQAVMLLHVALGGQQDETVFFFDQMLKRQVHFDIIGLSYYPKWHGSLDDLRDNMLDLEKRYNKDIIVVEYSARKEEVNRLVFGLPGGKGKGSFIWEPLSTWEQVFDRDGKSNHWLKSYDRMRQLYLKK